jgi:hypothetical protein
MSELGKWLAIFGVGSFALNYFNMEFKLLMWVDMWGPTVGNMIRVGFIVVGVALFFAGAKAQAASVEEDSFEDIEAPAQQA